MNRLEHDDDFTFTRKAKKPRLNDRAQDGIGPGPWRKPTDTAASAASHTTTLSHRASRYSPSCKIETRERVVKDAGSSTRSMGGSSLNRRGSLDIRGRRASSLMERGQAAIPHPEVHNRDFYKHISADLLATMRMRQLLMWCSERAMLERPQQGVLSSSPALGALSIFQELSDQFSTRPDFSNWQTRGGSVTPAGRILAPNPRNIELDKKMASLEARIKRLETEKKAWLSVQKPVADQPQLFPFDDTTQQSSTTDTDTKLQLSDFDPSDADEDWIRKYLTVTLEPFSLVHARTESRLNAVHGTLEFEIDRLADASHKLEQRVQVADRQADAVLDWSARMLKERDVTEKSGAGTRHMPMMDVLRSLTRLLSERGGGGTSLR